MRYRSIRAKSWNHPILLSRAACAGDCFGAISALSCLARVLELVSRACSCAHAGESACLAFLVWPLCVDAELCCAPCRISIDSGPPSRPGPAGSRAHLSPPRRRPAAAQDAAALVADFAGSGRVQSRPALRVGRFAHGCAVVVAAEVGRRASSSRTCLPRDALACIGFLAASPGILRVVGGSFLPPAGHTGKAPAGALPEWPLRRQQAKALAPFADSRPPHSSDFVLAYRPRFLLILGSPLAPASL